MMTGVPDRKASPITRASLYERGCTVVMRRSSGAAEARGERRIGVTGAVYSGWASGADGGAYSSSSYSST